MVYRRNKKKRNIPAVVALMLVLCFLAGSLLAAKIYQNKTGEDFSASYREALRIGWDYVKNFLSSKDNSVPLNPYTEMDYYWKDDFLACSTSPASMVGIDVSSHQGEIDWQAVKAAGVDFAIIRVGYRGYTDGNLFTDTTGVENLHRALEAGLEVGVYFFSQATTQQEALEEAWYVLDTIDGFQVKYPVMFDWEMIANDPDARTNNITGDELTLMAKTFCDQIAQAGYTPGIYFNQNDGYGMYNLKELKSYPFWLAEYQNYQSFAYEVQLWQYSCSGTVPGIENTVDLNISYRDFTQPQTEEGEENAVE